jgi:hypothetical protein
MAGRRVATYLGSKACAERAVEVFARFCTHFVPEMSI